MQRVDGIPAAVRLQLPQEPPPGFPSQIALQAWGRNAHLSCMYYLLERSYSFVKRVAAY